MEIACTLQFCPMLQTTPPLLKPPLSSHSVSAMLSHWAHAEDSFGPTGSFEYVE